MSHRSPSSASSLDQVNGDPKRSEEDLVSKTSTLASSPDQVSSPPYRHVWPEENFTSTADEAGGFYPVRLGETFEDGRFVITRKLGWGGFSSVWLARDRKEKRHVALKVLSSYASREIEAGRLGERDILQKITNAAPLHPGFQHVVHLLDEFTFESFLGRHVCFVTNVLCYNVPGLQKEINDLEFSLGFILRLAKHVLKGLEYLHDECGVVHSDLKPANLLLMASNVDEVVMRELFVQPGALYDYPKVLQPKDIPIPPPISAPLFHAAPNESPPLYWVIADFGHAHLQQKHLSDVVQPYALRAPEVILGLAWGPPIDIWSLGCMMYEFASGHWLFKPEAKDDVSRDIIHLAQMAQRTGQDHDDAALKQYETREKQTDLKGLLKRATAEGAELPSIESELKEALADEDSPEEVAAFTRIMLSFLTLDPARRPRAAEALLDPGFDLV